MGSINILESLEQGWTYRIVELRYPTADPNYAMVHRFRGRFTYYYFYILDEVAGPMVLRIGSFLPFAATAYINGHSFLEQHLRRAHVAFQKRDNSFLSVSDPAALQAAADGLDWKVIQQRLEYWTLIVGPKFSKKERAACEGLHRLWAVSQVEYCLNFIFHRAWPIRDLFRRCCELSLVTLTADRVANVFGQRVLKRMPGKFTTVVARLDAARHVLRSYWRHSFVKQYEKWNRFLRLEGSPIYQPPYSPPPPRSSATSCKRTSSSTRPSPTGNRCASASPPSSIALRPIRPSTSMSTALLTWSPNWPSRSPWVKAGWPASGSITRD